MLKYLGKRVLQLIPVFIGVTILLFLLRAPGVLPGDPVRLITGERPMSDVMYQQIVEEEGLDQPLHVQYVRYVGGLLQGDFGTSYQKNRPVWDIFRDKYPNTLRLALAAIVIEILIGIGAGVISAVRRGSFTDALVTLSTSVLVALPVFWLAMLMQLMFGVYLKDWGLPHLPISGVSSDAFPDWVHLILPALTLASVATAYAARIMRSQMLEVSRQDHVRTAIAKGLSSRAVTWNHTVRNALIPVITFIGVDLGFMVGGAILTETVFNWPGVGREIFLAIGTRDWPIVMGGVIIVVIAVMVINLIVDVGYAVLDPRVRLGGTAEGAA